MFEIFSFLSLNLSFSLSLPPHLLTSLRFPLSFPLYTPCFLCLFPSSLSLSISPLFLCPHIAPSFQHLLCVHHLAPAGARGLWTLLRREEEMGQPHSPKAGMEGGNYWFMWSKWAGGLCLRDHPLPRPGLVPQT